MPSSLPHTGEARITELVRAYLAAEYRWERDGEWLNLRIGELAPAVAAHFADATHFGLLSAWDPLSVPRSEAVNRDADEALQQALFDSGRAYRPAFSSAPNRTWREPGWLVVDIPLEALDALSQRHGQLATLYWPAHAPVRMRVNAARPLACEHFDSVDWLQA